VDRGYLLTPPLIVSGQHGGNWIPRDCDGLLCNAGRYWDRFTG